MKALAPWLFLAVASCGGAAKPVPAPEAPSPPPPAATTVEPRVVTGLPACDEYMARSYAFAHCEALPAEARQNLMVGLQSLVSAAPDLQNASAESRAATDDGCRQGVQSLLEHGSDLRCDLSIPTHDYVAEIVAYQPTGPVGDDVTCLQYATVVDRYSECDKVPREARDQAQQRAIETLEHPSATVCREAREALVAEMDSLGCAY